MGDRAATLLHLLRAPNVARLAANVGELFRGYSLWESGPNRFAVTPAQSMVPVLGYVSLKAAGVWIAEKHGQILRVTYSSSAAAAKALLDSQD